MVSPRARMFGAVLALTLANCGAAPPATSIAAAPPFVAEQFFAGRLDGIGRLAILFHAPRATHVASAGHVAVDGTLLLDQHVEQQGKPARDRHWAIHPLGGGRYSGTLTDASGAVTGDTRGNRLHLTYPMHGGLRVDQWLTLSRDARSAQNRMIVRKIGIVVARLDETIRKLP